MRSEGRGGGGSREKMCQVQGLIISMNMNVAIICREHEPRLMSPTRRKRRKGKLEEEEGVRRRGLKKRTML